MNRQCARVLLLGLLLAPALAWSQAQLNYIDLVKRLTDLERLAVLPAPGETCQQWSSYDRRSRYDGAKQAYVDWSANGDGTGVIRREGDREVLAEMDGPGVIWRIWSARAGAGHVRIYLDGADSPAVDLPFIGYFDGKNPPFQGQALCHTVARGLNCYVPLPYATSCRIVADKGWGRYFQFVYTTFPKGTTVPTFTRDLTPEETQALARANEFLTGKLGSDPAGRRPDAARVEKTVTVPAGGAVTIADLKGPRAITEFRVQLDLPAAPDDIAVLRQLCLDATWDNAAQPQVWAPLGDFFGSAPGFHPYQSLPLGVTEEGMYSFWYMPFAERAVLRLTNDGEQARSVTVSVVHAPLARDPAQLARFHAKWHRDAFLPTDPARRAIDWTMLTTRGRGRYLGVMLHVWNPRGGWWGEGDEKFFVDGERFPSTIGTGSEDYFGYAWCCPERFENAYHNQPHNDGGNRGHVCVNRWQITDNIPFQTSFEGAIEKYYPNRKPTLYAATVYWYLAPGGSDRYEPAPVEDRTGYYGGFEVPRVKGALEGEKLRVVACTGGRHRSQDMNSFGGNWSGIEHLWWTDGKPGDRLKVEFPVAKPGRNRVLVQLTKARDYGIVQLYLGGRKLGDPVDLYNPEVIPTGVIDLGVHEVAGKTGTLTMELTGANPKAVKAYMAGLDYIKLEPVD